jgi:hypothetical protein
MNKPNKHPRRTMPSWDQPHSIAARKLAQHNRPAITEWKELDEGTTEAKRPNFEFYSVAPTFAYAIISALLFGYIFVAIANYNGSFSMLALVTSLGFAMMSAGRLIEWRSGKERK